MVRHAHSGGYNVYRHYTIIASQLRLRHAHSGGYNVYRHYTMQPETLVGQICEMAVIQL